MLHRLIPAALPALFLTALPAVAEPYTRISDKDAFLGTIAGKELRMGMLGITLEVAPDGNITGRALGWDVTGAWEWQDGYFCREMDWSGYPIPHNCQLVEVRNDREIRFTVDKGTGDSAAFNLR